MTTLEVRDVKLSGCTLASTGELAVARENAATIHYCLEGQGSLIVDDRAPIPMGAHTLVIVPRQRPQKVLGSAKAFVPQRTSERLAETAFTPGSPRLRQVGDGEPVLTLVYGHFEASFGASLDLFASLDTPVIETFDAHDQLGPVTGYAMAGLAAGEVGGRPMSQALLKLVLLALLRRARVSSNPWVERFAVLTDPPIARAFAEMVSRPSLPHTVETLAHAAGLSRSAFIARFGSAFGEAPISVLRRLRMRNAAALLEANVRSIDQVALLAGYQSRSSFTRTFRRVYGTDPSKYRAGVRRMAAETQAGMHEPVSPAEQAVAPVGVWDIERGNVPRTLNGAADLRSG